MSTEDKLKTRVLVVDDHQIMVRIVTKLLEQCGFNNIATASSGLEAKELLENAGSDKFGMIISDWNMPDMTGLQLLEFVRGDATYKNTPFIMVTAESKPANVELALKMGATNYIAKPFNQETLQSKVDAALNIVR